MNRFRVPACVLLVLASACTCNSQDRPTAGRRVDGYKGIWFTLGQYYGKGTDGEAFSAASRKPIFPYGDKYSGGLGTYTAKHTPLAIYSKTANKTFFVYGGTTRGDERHLLCMVSYYDHTNHRVPKPVVVHDKQSVDDPHDNPSLAIDDAGHLWVFVSGRGTIRSGFKYRSRRPLSIDGFELVSEEEMTYPQPHFVPERGCLHLFTKYTGVRELYWESSDDGRAWTADRKLAGIREPGDSRGGHYQTSAVQGNRIGTFFNRHPNGNVDRRTDLYYVESDDMGATWKTVQAEVLATPLTEVNNPARVADFASKQRNVYLKDMGFDAHGHPVLLYVTSRGHQPGAPNDPRQFEVVRWNGAQWLTSVVCAADHNYDMGSLYLGLDAWTVCVPGMPGPQAYHAGGELAYWHSSDSGATWNLKQQITHNSKRNHNYARRPVGATDPFNVFWADGDPTQLSESHLYFADASGNRVWRLPYDMNNDWATPKLVTRPSDVR